MVFERALVQWPGWIALRGAGKRVAARWWGRSGRLPTMNSDLTLLLVFVAGLALGGFAVFWLLRARAREVDAERDGLMDAFKALSADALERNNQRFLELAKLSLERQQDSARGELEKRQQAIGELVAPMKGSLEKFEQQIANVEK
jgi:DNA recombination protein RmuC